MAYLQNFGIVRDVLPLGTTISDAKRRGLSRIHPIRVAHRADAPFGFADLDDVAEVAARVLLEPGHAGATHELASVSATLAEVADAAGVAVEVVITPQEWAATDGKELDPRERVWLLAMFSSYDRHGLPVGTLQMRRCQDTRDDRPAARRP